MSKRKHFLRHIAVTLAFLLTFSNLTAGSVHADECETTVETTEVDTTECQDLDEEESSPSVEEDEELADEAETFSEDSTTEEVTTEEATTEESTTEEMTVEEKSQTETIGKLQLVYGNETLADEDALVLLIMGDGFTAEEQDKFYAEAKNTADYIMQCSPYDEFRDVFKIYALGVVSRESGVQGEKASSEEEAKADVRDTYFGATFWSYSMQRLVTLSEEGEQKGNALRDSYLPAADYNVYIVNSKTYGGSGGDYCIASLNNQSLEMMLHEMGHTIGKLSDEYYASGYEEETANLTQESDPDKVRWSRFVGKNGVGVYDWGGASGTGWYIPHTGCKMQYLGEEYPFCEVCKEQLRKSFCEGSNVTKIFFQTYADEFMAGTGKDMREYFILRKGSHETTGDQLGEALTLTYYDTDGNMVNGIPDAAGTYTIEAAFTGNDTYDACSMTTEYTIDSFSISMSITSKAQDGKPAELKFDVCCDEEYTLGISYEGYQYYGYYTYDVYSSSMTSDTPDTSDDLYDVCYYKYDSYNNKYLAYEEYQTTEGPTNPGKYTVTLTVYDKTGNVIGEKSADFVISLKTEKMMDNNSSAYYGASDYGNNKTILIYGEGFTEEEQEKFLQVAKQFTDGIFNTEPFKETKQYFNVTAVECVSNESGIGTEAKDTFFGLTYDENGAIVPSYGATDIATYLASYNINQYYDACLVIVNDDKAKESATYYYDYGSYAYYHTIFATPDAEGIAYAANELLNHLLGNEVGYCAKTKEEKETQRLALLKSMYYEYAPVIISRAYDEKFVENGTAYDLTSYFQVYYGTEELYDVPLKLTYYTDDQGKPGTMLDSAPSYAGTYHVQAETIPNDVDGWLWYVPEDTAEEDGIWIGASRGWTTYTIKTVSSNSDSTVSENISVSNNSDTEESSTVLTSVRTVTVTIADDVAPLADTPVLLPDGYTYEQIVLGKDSLLKVALLQKYYGQKVYFATIFSKEAAMTLDMQEVTSVAGDLKLGYTLATLPAFAEEFDTIHAIPLGREDLSVHATLHFHVGNEYMGRTAYIFAWNAEESKYSLIKVMPVNEVGNVAFDTTDFTDVIIMIAK